MYICTCICTYTCMHACVCMCARMYVCTFALTVMFYRIIYNMYNSIVINPRRKYIAKYHIINVHVDDTFSFTKEQSMIGATSLATTTRDSLSPSKELSVHSPAHVGSVPFQEPSLWQVRCLSPDTITNLLSHL